jgi:septal ring factor EnvC (AmiA/AmiB activator)
MLASYSSVADIDAKHARTVTGAQADIKTAEERLEAAQARVEKLRQSVDRYNSQSKAVPETLRANLRDSEADLVIRQKNLELKEKELVTIEAHFDHDRRRFLELTGKNHRAEPAPATPVR